MTVHRAFLEWLESFFRPNLGLIASDHGARRGTDGGFQPMRTRQVGRMAFVIPPTTGSLEEDGVNRPFRIASLRGCAKTRRKRRITAILFCKS